MAAVVLHSLLGGAAAQVTASPCSTISDVYALQSRRRAVEFVSTSEALQWAVGNGTELIVIEQDLDLRTTPVATDELHSGALNVTDTVALQVRLV